MLCRQRVIDTNRWLKGSNDWGNVHMKQATTAEVAPKGTARLNGRLILVACLASSVRVGCWCVCYGSPRRVVLAVAMYSVDSQLDWSIRPVGKARGAVSPNR